MRYGTFALSILFQSTLSVRRATGLRFDMADGYQISIHALRKESDQQTFPVDFYPAISIHALRKESDFASILLNTHCTNFNPRSP